MKHLARTLGWGGCLVVLLAVVAPTIHGQDKDKDKGKQEGKTAKVTVLVPDEDNLTLTVNGKPTKATGTKRVFETPALKDGPKYSYTFAAKWEPNNYETYTRTRKIFVKPGDDITLDLTKKDPKIPDDIFIRYVPTPPEFIEAMMKLARVGKDDVVYDLGCGDGRIVIAAVSKWGAKRGVGIDLDQKRLDECKENAEKAKVGDKLEFRKQDVMKIPDLEKATVVAIYLSDGLNEQLWPILQKNCKPGTRIVTHRFKMGENKPEKSVDVKADDGYAEQVHLWTVGKKPEKEEKDKDKKEKDKDDK
jgi:uncharacterized protein (TIGR03000 family)